MTPVPMLCARCASYCMFPRDFPDSTYAICAPCYPAWSGHPIAGSRPWMARLYAFGRFVRRCVGWTS